MSSSIIDVSAGFTFCLSDGRTSWELHVNLALQNCRCDASHKSWHRLARKHLLWRLKRVFIKTSARNFAVEARSGEKKNRLFLSLSLSLFFLVNSSKFIPKFYYTAFQLTWPT
ncbi:hypothetical protein PUN28_009077 [Cardiocondyla obscurior]|uniref:Uncharacterized protein n=1 Tax=Cardiocondyla obscurior TaxID=286306 RepID=A0AAW2FSG0_9HYME